MSMVLDASAILAFLQGEDGAAEVDAALEAGALCGAANWSEVAPEGARRRPRLGSGARVVAKLRPQNRTGRRGGRGVGRPSLDTKRRAVAGRPVVSGAGRSCRRRCADRRPALGIFRLNQADPLSHRIHLPTRFTRQRPHSRELTPRSQWLAHAWTGVPPQCLQHSGRSLRQPSLGRTHRHLQRCSRWIR